VLLDLTNPRTNATFLANLANDAASTIQGVFAFDNLATEAASDFWTVYVLAAYQMEPISDSDPGLTLMGDESATFGIVDDINGQGALIFMECLREFPPTMTVSEAFTVSHEVGHLFNGVHSDGGLMAQSLARTSVNFSPQTLNRIRSIPHP
jgi:hypothetical protein